MTKDEVLLMIEKAQMRDDTICTIRGRYAKLDLALCLCFIYYSHLKMADVLRIKPENIDGRHGRYYSERNKCEMEFEISPKFTSLLYFMMYQKERKNKSYLILKKKRALITAFNQIASENGIQECRITDVLYAGLVDNADVKKPYVVKGDND